MRVSGSFPGKSARLYFIFQYSTGAFSIMENEKFDPTKSGFFVFGLAFAVSKNFPYQFHKGPYILIFLKGL